MLQYILLLILVYLNSILNAGLLLVIKYFYIVLLVLYLSKVFVYFLHNQFVYMCVLFVNEMFFGPVDDTRPVWESSSPLFLSSPTSSLAYISSINPVLGGLLWSLCVLWAMVIICLLRSHCFMRLVCSPPPVPLSLSLIHTISGSLSLPFPFAALFCIHVHSLPLTSPYYSTVLLFFTFHLLSFALLSLFCSQAFTVTQAQQFNL